MRFVTRAACAVLLTLAAYVSTGCSDKSTEPAKDDPTPTWKHVWSKRFGDADHQFARAVAVDTLGNSIVTGFFYGSVDFGGGALTSEGAYDIFLVKLGPTGAHIWSKRFGDASEQVVQSVAVDSAGNIYIAGYFEGSVDFGGGTITSAGLRDIFLAKLGPDGSHIWAKRFGDTNHQSAHSLVIDSFGNIIMTGIFMGNLDLGGPTLIGSGGWDIFVVKRDSDGGHIWSDGFGDGNNQYASTVAVDGSGNIFVAGYFQGAIDFGGGTLTSAGNEDIYLAKFAPGGGHEWSKRFGDASTDQEAWGVAVDGFGNAIVAGHFTGSVDFGGGALPNAGAQPDIFVAKFGSDGSHLWSKHFGDAQAQSALAVAVDPSDNVLVAGGFNGTVNFGGGTLSSGGAKDVFLAKLDSDGAHIWSRGFGDVNYQEAQALATGPSGDALVAGYFAGAISFGGGTFTSAGGEDIFVAKFGVR